MSSEQDKRNDDEPNAEALVESAWIYYKLLRRIARRVWDDPRPILLPIVVITLVVSITLAKIN